MSGELPRYVASRPTHTPKVELPVAAHQQSADRKTLADRKTFPIVCVVCQGCGGCFGLSP